jgi:hypothetical protein
MKLLVLLIALTGYSSAFAGNWTCSSQVIAVDKENKILCADEIFGVGSTEEKALHSYKAKVNNLQCPGINSDDKLIKALSYDYIAECNSPITIYVGKKAVPCDSYNFYLNNFIAAKYSDQVCQKREHI